MRGQVIHPAGCNRCAGLTLIEVLLAALILGLSMSVLLTAMSRCMLLFQTVHRYHEALAVLGEAEAEFPLVDMTRKPDMTPEDFAVSERPYGHFTFTRTVEDPEQFSAEGNQPRLLIVRSTASWTLRGRRRTEEMTRYVFFQPHP